MKRRQKGFTLKDLMIVVAIIVIVVFWVNTFPRSDAMSRGTAIRVLLEKAMATIK